MHDTFRLWGVLRQLGWLHIFYTVCWGMASVINILWRCFISCQPDALLLLLLQTLETGQQFINNAKHSSNGVFTPESALRRGRQSSGISCLGYTAFPSLPTTTALPRPRRRPIPWAISILVRFLQATVQSISISIGIVIGIRQSHCICCVCVCMFVDLTTIAETYTVRWSLSGSWDFARQSVCPETRDVGAIAPKLLTTASGRIYCYCILVTQNHSEWVFSSDNLNTFHLPVSWGRAEMWVGVGEYSLVYVQHSEHSLAWVTSNHFANWQHGNNTYGALNRTL